MRKAAIVPKTVLRFKVTTDSRHAKAVPNLLGRVLTAAQPNDCWLTEITFIATRAGWLYLAAIIDLHSSAVVGWSMCKRMDGKLVMDALGMVLERRGKVPDILRSDRCSTALRFVLKQNPLFLEMLSNQGVRLPA